MPRSFRPAAFLLLCASVLPACSLRPSPGLPDLMAPQVTGLTEIPARVPLVRSSMGLPLVEATINGRHRAVFLFDTGASTAIVSPRLIEAASLSALPSTFDHFGSVQGFYEIDALDLGGVRLFRLLATNDARKILDDFSASVGVRVDGVLSLSNFGDLLVTADFENYELRFQPGRLARSAVGTERSRPDAGRPVIRIDFSDGEDNLELPFIVDTGAAGGLQFPTSYRTLPFKARPVTLTHYRTYYGDNSYLTLELDGQARIGGAVLRSPRVELHQDGTDILGEKFGTIGMRTLHGLTLDFDSERRLVRITGGETQG